MPGAASVSLRSYLLVGIFGSVLALAVIETVLSHQSAARSLALQHDRMLQAAANMIGELARTDAGTAGLRASQAFEAFEPLQAGSGTSVIYQLASRNGDLLAGSADLPVVRSSADGVGAPMQLLDAPIRVDGVEKIFRIARLRLAQSDPPHSLAALVQVAEPLESRVVAARRLLIETLKRQLLMMTLAALAIAAVVYRAIAPLRAVHTELLGRGHTTLQPLMQHGTLETKPIIEALNALLQHLQEARGNQQRLIANAAHQLRTPLAVLKLHLQSVTSGNVAAVDIVSDMEKTVTRAAHVTDQLLSLAKVDQMRQHANTETVGLDEVTRDAALELSPLITAKRLDFELQTEPVTIVADHLLTGELIRNLMSNAIRHCPPGRYLGLSVQAWQGGARLMVSDSGPGIGEDQMNDLFQPFNAASTGAGLGLAIVKSIAEATGATVVLRNRVQGGQVRGLDAEVVFPARLPSNLFVPDIKPQHEAGDGPVPIDRR
jgi:two-component system sensor histidine kinase TctE